MKELSNQDIKRVTRYHLKKYRLQDKLFLAEGTKLISELMASKIKIKTIIVTDNWLNNHKLDNFEVDWMKAEPKKFKRISQQHTPDGILAICEIPEVKVDTLPKDKWVLALDFIQNPGNLGTIIRTADWFGIQSILCSSNTTDAFSSKVVQASMASIGRVNIIYCDLLKTLPSLGLPIFGATLSGMPIQQIETPSAGVVVIGNESNGISQSLQSILDVRITISKLGKAESLNAGIATGILLHQLTLQVS